jgi:hyaluronate lyase
VKSVKKSHRSVHKAKRAIKVEVGGSRGHTHTAVVHI